MCERRPEMEGMNRYHVQLQPASSLAGLSYVQKINQQIPVSRYRYIL
jgi:hypothetical protein